MQIRVVAALLTLTPIAFAATKPVNKPAVEVTGNNLEQTARCTDNTPLRILANDSRLSVLGNCTTVTVVGSRNWMTVQHARTILATGDRNTVLYDDPSTRVSDRGKANSLAQRWPQ